MDHIVNVTRCLVFVQLFIMILQVFCDLFN
jgi:hypothetical protein